MGDGFVKLFRSIEQWEWYTNSNTKCLFLHCLIKTNYVEKSWRGKKVDKGSFITSLSHLSIETGMTISQIRTALDNLQSTNEIKVVVAQSYTQIYVVKWCDYQDKSEYNSTQISTQDSTPNSIQDSNLIATTNNNKNIRIKEEKNNTKISRTFVQPSVSDVENYVSENNFNVDANSFIDYYTSNGWQVGRTKMKDWKATVRNWDRKNANNGKPAKKVNKVFEQWGVIAK